MTDEGHGNGTMVDDTMASDRALSILAALGDLRSAELKLLRRRTELSGLKENDLAAMRLLRDADRAGAVVGPKDLALSLGITSASVTVLLDRLEKRGLATRSPNPDDRRSLRLQATPDGLDVVAGHDDPTPVRDLLDALGDEDALVVERFFRRLTDAAATVNRSGGR